MAQVVRRFSRADPFLGFRLRCLWLTKFVSLLVEFLGEWSLISSTSGQEFVCLRPISQGSF